MPDNESTPDTFAAFRDTCGSCAAPILWATTTGRKRMPVNATPSPQGNVLLEIGRADNELAAAVLNRGQAAGARDRDVPLYRSHFADCKHADRHRRRR